MLEDLQKILDSFINNAERLLKMGSTQGNESFNNIVASKNPNNRFYGGYESTAFRVAAAISQKNIGHDALSKVCLYSYLNLYYINILFIFHSYLHVSINLYTIVIFLFSLCSMKTYYCHLERIHNCFLHVLRTNAHITRTSNPALHTINAAMNSSSTTNQVNILTDLQVLVSVTLI